jgi:hypothetical protein
MSFRNRPDPKFLKLRNEQLKHNIARHNRKIDENNRRRALNRELQILEQPFGEMAQRLWARQKIVNEIRKEIDDLVGAPTDQIFFSRLEQSKYLTTSGDLSELGRYELLSTHDLLLEVQVAWGLLQKVQQGGLRLLELYYPTMMVLITLANQFASFIPGGVDLPDVDSVRFGTQAAQQRNRFKILERLESFHSQLQESTDADFGQLRANLQRAQEKIALYKVKHGL